MKKPNVGVEVAETTPLELVERRELDEIVGKVIVFEKRVVAVKAVVLP